MVKRFLGPVRKMMKARIFSNDCETITFEEKEEELLIKVESVLELSHYIVPFVKFIRFAKKFEEEQENQEVTDIEVKDDFEVEQEDKPLKLKIGPVKIGLN